MNRNVIDGLVTAVWALAVGDEVQIGTRVFFRIDRGEYKVHAPGEPDGKDSSFVPRDLHDVREWIEAAVST